MAWRLLAVLLFITSLLFSFDYEVVRNHDGDQDSLSLYLNNREYLTVIGCDPVSAKRVYTFVARLLEQSELQNDPSKLVFRLSNKGGGDLWWQDTSLISLSQAEKDLNDKRQNTVLHLREFARTIQLDGDAQPISLAQIEKVKFKAINHIQLAELAGQAFGALFPASHPFLPIGTRMRVMNPNKDWSIVVQIVRHDKWVSDCSLGLSSKAIHALGMEGTGVVKTQFM
jgi:hypothetical protein